MSALRLCLCLMLLFAARSRAEVEYEPPDLPVHTTIIYCGFEIPKHSWLFRTTGGTWGMAGFTDRTEIHAGAHSFTVPTTLPKLVGGTCAGVLMVVASTVVLRRKASQS